MFYVVRDHYVYVRMTPVAATSRRRHLQIGSRRVIQVGAGLLVFVGMFGKLGALVGLIPVPVIGGLMLAVMGT